MKEAKALKEVITAIESGQKIEDHRGLVYKQEFGESFLNKLKEVLKSNTIFCEHKSRITKTILIVGTCEVTIEVCADCNQKLTEPKTDCL